MQPTVVIDNNTGPPNTGFYAPNHVAFSEADTAGWLYQINPSGGNVPSDFVLFLPGDWNTYFATLGDADYQTEWLNKNERFNIGGWFSQSTSVAQAQGFHGEFLENYNAAVIGSAGKILSIPQVQSFTQNIFGPDGLRGGGLFSMVNCCSQSYCKGEATAYCLPSFQASLWQSFTANDPRDRENSNIISDIIGNPADLQNNSRDTVPDGFFQEWAFFQPTDGDGSKIHSYYAPYWLDCLQDMDAVANTNASYPDNPQYYFAQVVGVDLTADPAYGLDGWMRFGLCSYLLGTNDWTVFEVKDFSLSTDPMSQDVADFEITATLGVPSGSRQQVNSTDPYFQYRLFAPAPGLIGSVGGIVVVNANVTESQTFTVPSQMVDEDGTVYAANSTLTLQPHTGRILTNAN